MCEIVGTGVILEAYQQTTSKELTVNKAKIIELLEDGAYFNSGTNQLMHPSFRNGWRKMKWNDISWQAVERAHGLFGSGRLIQEDQIYLLAKSA